MTDTTQPLLVYDRIEANKRQTRGLLALVPVVFLPLISVIGLLVSLTPAFALIAFLPVMAFGFVMLIAYEMKVNLSIPEMAPEILTALSVAGPLLIAALALIFATRFLISRYGAHALLRLAGATPLDPLDEPELVRVVENLCIGAGLPAPSIYVTNSPAPNAFATGTSPHRAALVVTRGLLNLLNRRELEGVIAHELSHIGNDDIRLTTTLAALVGVATIPLTIVRSYFLAVFTDIAPNRTADERQASSRIGLGFCLGTLFFVGIFGLEALTAWVEGGWFGVAARDPSDAIWLTGLSLTRSPVCVLLFAPVLALLIRQAVLQEREYLADADAVRLTRDPEGLALALVKIGAAGHKTLVADEGSVHLYFADPLDTSLLHAFFPSHPPLASRIALLAQMGSGIPASALRAARQAGARLNHDRPTATESAPSRTDIQPPAPHHESDHDGSIDEGLTPVYEQADGWSRVVAWIPQTAAITPVGSEGRFIRVVTTDNVTGYVAASAPLSGLAPVRR